MTAMVKAMAMAVRYGGFDLVAMVVVVESTNPSLCPSHLLQFQRFNHTTNFVQMKKNFPRKIQKKKEKEKEKAALVLFHFHFHRFSSAYLYIFFF